MSQLKPAIWLAPSFSMIIQLPIADRDPGPYPAKRRCLVCRCFLSRNNPRGRCAPCELASMPVCEVVDLHPEDVA